MKYSLCSISFRHELVSFHDLVRFACDKGFTGVELWGIHACALLRRQAHEVPGMLERMEAGGVCISMISDYMDICVEEYQEAAMIERWLTLISTAKSFRTNKLRIFAGNRPSAAVDSKTWAQSIKRLQLLARIASESGIYLVIETHPNTFADTLASTLRLMHETGHPHIRINLDFLHLWESGSDPLEAYRILKPWTVNYHLKNISGRDKLGVFAPCNVYSPNGDRDGMTTLSEGTVDYSPIIRQWNHDNSAYTAAIEWFGDQPYRYLDKELDWLSRSELLHECSVKA